MVAVLSSLQVKDTTDATAQGTGSLQVAGGVSIAKSLLVAGAMVVSSTAAATSTTTGALQIAGGAGIQGDVYVGRGVTVAGALVANGGRTYLRDNCLEEYKTAGLANIGVNYAGYAGGFTHWRNFDVFDGKGGTIASFEGSSKTLRMGGPISVVGGGATADPYGSLSVTLPANTTNYGYIGMTRAGQAGWMFGINTNNSLVFGTGTSGAPGTINNQFVVVDTSGNMSVSGYISAASFSGNGANLTGITATGISASDTTNLATYYPIFTSQQGSGGTINSSSYLTYNPYSGVLASKAITIAAGAIGTPSTATGTLWMDNSWYMVNTYGLTGSSTVTRLVGCLFASTAPITTTSTTGTSMKGTAIFGNSTVGFIPGRMLRIRAWGYVSTSTTSGTTFTLIVKFGSTSIVSMTSPTLATSLATMGWDIEFMLPVNSTSSAPGAVTRLTYPTSTSAWGVKTAYGASSPTGSAGAVFDLTGFVSSSTVTLACMGITVEALT